MTVADRLSRKKSGNQLVFSSVYSLSIHLRLGIDQSMPYVFFFTVSVIVIRRYPLSLGARVDIHTPIGDVLRRIFGPGVFLVLRTS
jgi:hypothetical protein